MPNLIAAIDQGTTSTRCMLVDGSGAPVAVAQAEHEQIFPKAGWVEHDAMEIWQRTREVLDGAMREAGALPGDIAGIGVTNQRETTVVWDRRTGRPHHHAIVWQDTRTDAICKRLERDGAAEMIRRKTGLPVATYFSGPKIAWLLEHVSGLRDAAARGEALFGNIDTWLIWNLTGGSATGGAHVTDVTNASRTMLMDLESLDWDDELLALLGIPRAMLPAIRPSSDPQGYGETKGVDVPNGITVCGDLGDQQAALVGQTCFNAGEAKNTYGTGCFLLLNTGGKPMLSEHGLLTTVAYQFADQPACYALEGSIAVAGALVQWLRDNLGLIGSSAEVEELARSVDDNGGVYIVPAFSGLFAPHWRSDARGVIAGLTRYAHRGHLARAALEAVAFQTKEVVGAMQQDSGVALQALRVDGGMVVNELLMQFQADLLNVPVQRPTVAETTSLGAAYAAGLAVGVWKSTDDLKQHWKIDKQWEPQMDDATRRQLMNGWNKAVQRTLGWQE